MSVVLVAMDFVLVAMDVVLEAISVVSDLNLHRDDKRRPELVSTPSSKGGVLYHLQTTFDDLGHSDRKSSLYAAIRRAASDPSRMTRDMRPSSTAASSKPLIGLLRGIRPVRAPVVPGS